MVLFRCPMKCWPQGTLTGVRALSVACRSQLTQALWKAERKLVARSSQCGGHRDGWQGLRVQWQFCHRRGDDGPRICGAERCPHAALSKQLKMSHWGRPSLEHTAFGRWWCAHRSCRSASVDLPMFFQKRYCDWVQPNSTGRDEWRHRRPVASFFACVILLVAVAAFGLKAGQGSELELARLASSDASCARARTNHLEPFALCSAAGRRAWEPLFLSFHRGTRTTPRWTKTRSKSCTTRRPDLSAYHMRSGDQPKIAGTVAGTAQGQTSEEASNWGPLTLAAVLDESFIPPTCKASRNSWRPRQRARFWTCWERCVDLYRSDVEPDTWLRQRPCKLSEQPPKIFWRQVDWKPCPWGPCPTLRIPHYPQAFARRRAFSFILYIL